MFSDATITAITDIPPLVKAFATTVGMTNAGTTSNPTFTPVGGGQTFTMAAAHGGGAGPTNNDTLTLTGPGGTAPALVRSPRRATTPTDQTTLVPIAPTKLMLHGDVTPQPWISISIAYGFNWYRHMYIGVLEAIGGFTGGEVICGTSVIDSDIAFGGSGSYLYDDEAFQYLFRSRQSAADLTGCGGLHAVHASNPNSWRNFHFTPMGDALHVYNYDSITAMGGFGDQIVEPYMARGQAPFANATLLSPLNLYATMTGNVLVPLGRAPGIRMVDMALIDPETTLTIGSDNWRVIPAFGRNPSASTNYNHQTLQSQDSSWMVGYAFKK